MNTEQQKLRSNLWKFYLFDAFAGMLFAIPIIVLFWQDNGLNLTEIMILQSIFAILTLVLEIPTGYFADIFGRKKALFISGIGFLIGTSVYSISSNFTSFLVAEFFFAIGMSFYSGTGSAFVFDTLVDLKEEKNYNKYWGKAKYYGLMAMAFSNIVGGFVGKINLRWTFYLSIPIMFLLIPVTLSLIEPKRHKLVIEKNHITKLLQIVKSAFTDIKLRWLIIYAAIVMALTRTSVWLYQPYFILTGIDIAYFGILFAAFQIFTAFTSKYAHKIEAKIGQRTSLIMLVIILGISYFLMSKFVFFLSFIFIFLQQFVRGFSEPVLSDYVNKLTTSDVRATILSVNSMLGNLIYAITIPFIGWIADVYSILQALTIAGITTFVAGIIILIILHKDKVI